MRNAQAPCSHPKSDSPRALSQMPTEYPEVNSKVRQLWEDSGLSQEKFARKMEIPLPTLKAIIQGRVSPNFYVLKQLHEKANRSYDWLLEGLKDLPGLGPGAFC